MKDLLFFEEMFASHSVKLQLDFEPSSALCISQDAKGHQHHLYQVAGSGIG